MADDDTRDLDAILAHYDAKLAEKHAAQQQEKDAQRAFGEAFEKLCAEVLQPCFAAFQTRLEAVGHGVAIRREIGREGRDGLPRPAIYLDVTPKETPRSNSRTELPSIGFIGEPLTRTVALSKRCAMPSGGGLGGGREEYALEAVTATFCDEQVLDLLRRTLGRA